MVHLDQCVRPILLSYNPFQTAPLSISILQLNYKIQHYGLYTYIYGVEKSY
jgi:hypothetical protein